MNDSKNSNPQQKQTRMSINEAINSFIRTISIGYSVDPSIFTQCKDFYFSLSPAEFEQSSRATHLSLMTILCATLKSPPDDPEKLIKYHEFLKKLLDLLVFLGYKISETTINEQIIIFSEE